MTDLFRVLMQRGMQPGQPAPFPSAGADMSSHYMPPPPDRSPGWTQKPQPNQQTQAIGGGPGAATPSPGGPPGQGGSAPAPPMASMPPPTGPVNRNQRAFQASTMWAQGQNPTLSLNNPQG